MEKNTHTHTKIMGKKYVTNYRVKGEKTTRFFLYTYIREKSCAQYPTKLHRLHRRTLRFKVSLFLFLHHCRFSFLSSSYKLFLLYIYTDLYSFRSRIFPFFFIPIFYSSRQVVRIPAKKFVILLFACALYNNKKKKRLRKLHYTRSTFINTLLELFITFLI